MLEHAVGHANSWYLPRLRALWSQGDRVTSRGRTTREVLHVTTRLSDPRLRVLTIPFRRSNPFFQALEPAWILAGRSDALWITHYNAQLLRYLDPGAETFHGAYGERLRAWGVHAQHEADQLWGQRDQLFDVLQQLKDDPGSRRAVAVLHNPGFDNPGVETLDRPCNIVVSYQLRDGRLWAATFNRSNDYVLGLTYTNLVQFTVLQEFLAVQLGVEPGPYTHFSSSLHVYEDDAIVQRLFDRQAEAPAFDVYDYARPLGMSRTHPVGFGDAEAFTVRAGEERGWSGKGPSPLTRFAAAVRCPYWRGMAHMAGGWEALKALGAEPQTALARALGWVATMPACDWQVAAFEYLHRWATKRGLRTGFIRALDTLFEDGDIAYEGPDAEAVRLFILHDEVADGE